MRRTAHPRACGEHAAIERLCDDLAGSSPRLRGTPPFPIRRLVAFRLIPAPAGNTDCALWSPFWGTAHPRACGEHGDVPSIKLQGIGSSPRLRGTLRLAKSGKPPTTAHPRACGEHTTKNGHTSRICGSSPRLRGTPLFDRLTALPNRLIPAPAGNTGVVACGGTGQPAHPRACGEHGLFAPPRSSAIGSSPRLRGTRAQELIDAVPIRLIPAPAGNTCTACAVRAGSAAHPRACGEHQSGNTFMWQPGGSSPRLRGTQVRWDVELEINRLIPAPAGNTTGAATPQTHEPAHPRACGEHPSHETPASSNFGSSPRLRGTRDDRGLHLALGRLIPAPAGNTISTQADAWATTAHPRACGEHLHSRPHGTLTHGSSPRLRGTRSTAAYPASLLRLIPAPAGNTSPSTLPAASPHGSSPRLRGTQNNDANCNRPIRLIPAPAGNTGSNSRSARKCTAHPRACGEHKGQ